MWSEFKNVIENGFSHVQSSSSFANEVMNSIVLNKKATKHILSIL